jgi:hypothetical protein
MAVRLNCEAISSHSFTSIGLWCAELTKLLRNDRELYGYISSSRILTITFSIEYVKKKTMLLKPN